jgi:hypothetical protein
MRLSARAGLWGVVLAWALAACAAPSASPSPSANGAGIVAQVATAQLVADEPGRLLVALLSADNQWLSFGSVQVSFSYLGDGSSASPPPGVTLPDAEAEFLAIPGTPAGDGPPRLTLPADGRGLYAVNEVVFPRAGYWQVRAAGELDGSAWSANAAFEVLAEGSVPLVGEQAPLTDNPVAGDPGVPDSAIDSRARGGEPIPDPELHAVSIADAIAAGRPALVVFSTPVYCVSQFCGPVTDLVAELAAEYGDRADFIHVEIYRDFDAGEINQAALDWLTMANGDMREPWTFLIGADGRIAGSWDTVVTRGELEPLLQALPPGD